MAVMGTLYASKNVHPTSGIGRWVVILMIYVFAIVYSMSRSLFPAPAFNLLHIRKEGKRVEEKWWFGIDLADIPGE